MPAEASSSHHKTYKWHPGRGETEQLLPYLLTAISQHRDGIQRLRPCHIADDMTRLVACLSCDVAAGIGVGTDDRKGSIGSDGGEGAETLGGYVLHDYSW